MKSTLPTKKELVEAYTSNKSITEICKDFSISVSCFYRHMEKHNIPRTRGVGSSHWNYKIPTETVRKVMALKGRAYASTVAKKYGIAVPTVYSIWDYRVRYRDTLDL